MKFLLNNPYFLHLYYMSTNTLEFYTFENPSMEGKAELYKLKGSGWCLKLFRDGELVTHQPISDASAKEFIRKYSKYIIK